MARYRFRWEAVPAETLADIADALGLDGDAVTTLRRRYGARPTTRFVRELWPTLRDGWLAREDESRKWVADALRAARLSDPSIADDAAYLQSCRNAETLRRIVLDAFHVAGDSTPAEPEAGGRPPAQRNPEPEPRAHSRSGESDIDLDAVMASAWLAFTDRVRDALPMLGDDALIIGLPSPYDEADLDGVAPYVQFVIFAESMVRGEVSSNAFLDRRLQLSDLQQRQIEKIGWLPPTYAPDEEPDEGSPNFHLDVPLSEAGSIAAKAVAVIRDVFDVPHPSFLEWGGMKDPQGDGNPLDESQADLRKQVDRTLAAQFDEPLIHDDDGDIPIRAGTAMVFVRVAQDRPIVTLFSPLLVGCAGDALALERINRANRDLRFGRLTWSEGTLLASYELWCDPFVPETLLHAIRIMMGLADDMDDRLRVQLGGRRFFDDADDRTRDDVDEVPDVLHPALNTLFQLTADDTPLTPDEVAQVCEYDRDLVLSFIGSCEQDAIAWRMHAESCDDPEEAEVARGEEAAALAHVDLLRAALRVIVLD